MHTRLNGIDLYYDDSGVADAPVLIFIHGFPFDRTMWTQQAEMLKGHCRIVACDLRGHGQSMPGEEAFSMELFARDLLALMDTLGIEKAVLCALSMGGYIALRAVENHAERFEGLVLCDTQCGADTDEAKANRDKAIAGIRENGAEPFADALLDKLFAPQTMQTHRERVEEVRAMILATSPLSLERSLRAMRDREETCSKLSDIAIPVLIIVGEADRITPPETARFLHEHMKHSRLEIIADAGHLSNVENPAAFNAVLLRFLKDQCGVR